MKKYNAIGLSLLFCSFAAVPYAQAGDMGGNVGSALRINPFVSGEAAYSWYDYPSALSVNELIGRSDHQGWGGRFGAGLLFVPSDNWKYTSEVGWGYYAKSNSEGLQSALSASSTYDGFDILVGVDKQYNRFDFFIKGGAMLLDRRTSTFKSLGSFFPDNTVTGVSSGKSNNTEVLPEIKVGGIYNLTDAWGVTISYMHLFGGDTGYTNSNTGIPGENIVINQHKSSQLPTFNTILFGLSYILI